MAARGRSVLRNWIERIGGSRAPLSGDSFHRGDVEPGAGTSLAKKGQSKGRTVRRANTASEPQAQPGLSLKEYPIGHCLAHCRSGHALHPQGNGTAELQVVSGGNHRHSLPSA